ncbi:MAG: DUF192 domain-containing protein [Candidatus Parcubacteria bacterium]|nr:DUF192 domain-containing protein [Candidatus Parcubacteria bacterium]
MQNKNYFFGFVCVFIFLIVSYQFYTAVNIDNIKYVQIAGQNIQVELALTGGEQEQGLSGRQGLNNNEGMLFVFDRPDKYSFWMKDMNFPIDIIWINENMKVVYIKENALPNSYPETYESNENAKYILEVVSGFSEKNNFKIGDKVEFVYK